MAAFSFSNPGMSFAGNALQLVMPRSERPDDIVMTRTPWFGEVTTTTRIPSVQ
jgi:hypothetical protein